MSLLESRISFKPFMYPWAYDAFEMQHKIHWLPGEVALGDDVRDWNSTLTNEERNLLTQIFRFFTQADISVSDRKNFSIVSIKYYEGSFRMLSRMISLGFRHLWDLLIPMIFRI